MGIGICMYAASFTDWARSAPGSDFREAAVTKPTALDSPHRLFAVAPSFVVSYPHVS